MVGSLSFGFAHLQSRRQNVRSVCTRRAPEPSEPASPTKNKYATAARQRINSLMSPCRLALVQPPLMCGSYCRPFGSFSSIRRHNAWANRPSLSARHVHSTALPPTPHASDLAPMRSFPEIEIINDLFGVSGDLFWTSEIAFFRRRARFTADRIMADHLRRRAVK